MAYRQEKGFTMIELIIAIVILSIAIGTLGVVIANMTTQAVLPGVLNTSTQLAEQEMERVSGLRFSAIANEASTSYTGNFSAYSYQVTVSAVPVALANDPGQAQYKQVQVTVTHTAGGSISLTTIVTNN